MRHRIGKRRDLGMGLLQSLEARYEGFGALKKPQQRLAQCIETATQDGHVFGCPMINKPFTARGIFRPVKLPCGCVLSECAAQCSVQTKYCQLCIKPLSKWTTIAEDATSIRVIQARQLGVDVGFISEGCIHVYESIDRDAVRPVHNATFNRAGRHLEVTVEEVTMRILPRERAQVIAALTSSYLASSCPHVQQLYGISWRQNELWCVLQLHTSICAGLHTGICVEVLSPLFVVLQNAWVQS